MPLISTPLEPREIILGKIVGNIWAGRGIFVVLAIIWGLGAILDPGFCIAIMFMMGSLLILAVYASGLGVLYSLWCRTSMRAMAATLATGLFAGGLYLFCCIPLMIGGIGPGDEGIIILSGCIPFLLGFPGGIYVEGISHRNMSGPESNIIAAYFLGMIGYSIAAAVLISSSIRKFDRLSGRTGLLPYLSLRKKPAEPGPIHSAPKLREEPIRAELVE